MKSPRSSTVTRASLMSGSDCPRTSSRFCRLAGAARPLVTSTNILPPALNMFPYEHSRKNDNPRGFSGSVIIC